MAANEFISVILAKFHIHFQTDIKNDILKAPFESFFEQVLQGIKIKTLKSPLKYVHLKMHGKKKRKEKKK